MAELKNEFSWSKSRDETFRACPRQYYLRHYAFWGGWEANAPKRTRELYVLTKLVHRPMWAGAVVHDCIERTLKNLRRGIDVLSPEKIIETTVARMRDDFRSSRQKKYWQMPKTCALFEHEYALAVPDDQWRQTADDVRQCLRNFYTSDLYARFRALPREAWLEIEEFQSFTLDGIKIWAVLDCACRDGERLEIIDWKTGRRTSQESTHQLVCYALYAHEKWNVPLASITATEWYLLTMQPNENTVSRAEVEDTRAYIRASVADMHSLLADVTNNEPMAEGAFEKTDNEATCRRCNFLRPCRPELLSTGALP